MGPKPSGYGSSVNGGESGKTKDFKVVKGIHPAADREALRVMESLDYEFEPARQEGIVVSCRMVMAVRF